VILAALASATTTTRSQRRPPGQGWPGRTSEGEQVAPRKAAETAAALELYNPVGAYAFAGRDEAQRYAGLIAQARDAQAGQWFGFGSVRTFRAGSWFALTQAPLANDAPPAALLVAV